MLNSEFEYLRPFEENDLVRLGKKNDGGYIISKKSLDNDCCLLTFGMYNEWSFEEDFVKYKKSNFVHIYDHTVGLSFFIYRLYKSIKRLFYFKSSLSNVKDKLKELIKYIKLPKSKITHFKYRISNEASPLNKSLSDTINRTSHNGKIMLKIDIEGDEFKILDDINFYSEKIHTLIVEFHNLDINLNKFEKLIKEINNKFYIIHIHGNNNTGLGTNSLPKTLEITLLNYNIFFKNNKRINKKFPIKDLDYPNNPFKKDIEIIFK